MTITMASTTTAGCRTYFASIEVYRIKNDDGKIDDSGPKICFKRDGQRFSEEYTLKLSIDTLYEFRIQIRPPMPVRSVSMSNTTNGGDEIGLKIVDHSSPEDGCTYSFQWDTNNFEPDKRKKRSKMYINILFQDNMKLEIPLQIKFYKNDDQHHITWGTPLKHINFEYQLRPGQKKPEILKTCFL